MIERCIIGYKVILWKRILRRIERIQTNRATTMKRRKLFKEWWKSGERVPDSKRFQWMSLEDMRVRLEGDWGEISRRNEWDFKSNWPFSWEKAFLLCVKKKNLPVFRKNLWSNPFGARIGMWGMDQGAAAYEKRPFNVFRPLQDLKAFLFFKGFNVFSPFGSRHEFRWASEFREQKRPRQYWQQYWKDNHLEANHHPNKKQPIIPTRNKSTLRLARKYGSLWHLQILAGFFFFKTLRKI